MDRRLFAPKLARGWERIWLMAVATFFVSNLGLAQSASSSTASGSVSKSETDADSTDEAAEIDEASETEVAATDNEEDDAKGPDEASEVESDDLEEGDAEAQGDGPQKAAPDSAAPEATLADATVLTEDESPGEQDRRKAEEPSTRWSEVGAFVGMVSRQSSSDRFKYRPGIAYGGYFRPQITDFLAVRLSYREERIPVTAQPGAYDWDGVSHDMDLQQPDLKVTNLGLRIEPSYQVIPHLHLIGMLSWSWTRLVVPMPETDDFYQRADRASVELNWGLGGGIGVDLLKNWLSLSAIFGYHFVTNQTGSAVEESVQAIVDGQMTHFAPIARPKNMVDLLFSVGLIL